MSKKKQNNLSKMYKIILIITLVLAGFWLQSKLIIILGDLKATVFSDFDINPNIAEETVVEESDLPIPPITIIERHYIEVEVPTPAPTPVYSGGGSVSTKNTGSIPGSFAAGI